MGFLRKTFVFAGVWVFLSAPLAQAQVAPTPTPSAEQVQLQQQLKDLEQQIAQVQAELAAVRGEKATLANRLVVLKKEQQTLDLQAYLTGLQVAEVSTAIQKAQSDLAITQLKAAQYKQQIAQVMVQLYQQEQLPPLLGVVTADSISEAVTEFHNIASVGDSLQGLLNDARTYAEQLRMREAELAVQQQEAQELLSLQNLQRHAAAESVAEQAVLLADTKGKESTFQAALSDTQKQVQAIRSRLYPVVGATTQVQFGEAVRIAQWVSGMTGVRASFLLAILTQESSLGKNVGTCNRPGDPESKSWKVVMKPERDQEPFVKITAELGLDPNTTPVSCPMRDAKGNQVGWGGAMGPAQFIPSTWMGYKDKVSAITGKVANPWDIRDAFVAAAMKLGNDGAKTVEGEWAAAMRYFSGGTNTKYRFYGDNVVAQAERYQKDIEALAE